MIDLALDLGRQDEIDTEHHGGIVKAAQTGR